MFVFAIVAFAIVVFSRYLAAPIIGYDAGNAVATTIVHSWVESYLSAGPLAKAAIEAGIVEGLVFVQRRHEPSALSQAEMHAAEWAVAIEHLLERAAEIVIERKRAEDLAEAAAVREASDGIEMPGLTSASITTSPASPTSAISTRRSQSPFKPVVSVSRYKVRIEISDPTLKS